VGDFDPSQAESQARKYFERIPRGAKTPPDVGTLEVKQVAEKRMNAEAETNPQVDILWHTVPFRHRDSYALDILSEILATRTGRLYKGLVLGSGVATETYAQQSSMKWEGFFNAAARRKKGHNRGSRAGHLRQSRKVENRDRAARRAAEGKNNFCGCRIPKLSSNYPILMHLIRNDGEGDWREINEAGPKIQAVTLPTCRASPTGNFTKENRAVAIYTRSPARPSPNNRSRRSHDSGNPKSKS